ncbi:MAG: TetR/AcrR family transcriptional regulator [Eubacteriales bacterium]|jgi:AcrR family transcriptional regulator
MSISLEKQQKITDARKKQLVDAALELFDQNGYANTKISDITEKAGTSKGLFYHYFKSKDDILYEILDRVDECIRECNDIEDAIDSLTLFTERLLSYPYYEGYVPPIRVYFFSMIRGDIRPDDERNPITDQFGRDYFGPIFARGQKQGYFKDGDPAYFGDTYWKQLIGCMAIMNFDKKANSCKPDMKKMLALYMK